MICTVPGGELSRRLRDAALARELPVSGMFELTRRCCFRCVHCYAGPGTDTAGELTGAEWRRLIDESAAAGVLRLVFTGGEPLLRGDFVEIYSHARRAGIAVAVFTNAAHVDGAILRVFDHYPPALVEVTIYGATPATAARVTGVAEAWAQQSEGVARLRGAGLRVALKAVALRENAGEVAAIEQWARGMGLPFRLSTELAPAQDGSLAPLDHQLAPAVAVGIETADPERVEVMRTQLAARDPDDERRYTCRAGLTSFFIGADGCLQACVAVRQARESVVGQPLLPVWRRVRAAVRSARFTLAYDVEMGNTPRWLSGVLCPAALYDDQGRLRHAVLETVKETARQRVVALLGQEPAKKR